MGFFENIIRLLNNWYNDLGFLYSNNEIEHELKLGFHQFNENKRFNEIKKSLHNAI